MADFIVKMEGTFLVKKVILIIINLILVVTLFGCSTAESEPAGTNNTNDKTQLITENIPDYTDKFMWKLMEIKQNSVMKIKNEQMLLNCILI